MLANCVSGFGSQQITHKKYGEKKSAKAIRFRTSDLTALLARTFEGLVTADAVDRQRSDQPNPKLTLRRPARRTTLTLLSILPQLPDSTPPEPIPKHCEPTKSLATHSESPFRRNTSLLRCSHKFFEAC